MSPEVTRALLLAFISMNIFGLVTLTTQLFYLRQGLAINYEVRVTTLALHLTPALSLNVSFVRTRTPTRLYSALTVCTTYLTLTLIHARAYTYPTLPARVSFLSFSPVR